MAVEVKESIIVKSGRVHEVWSLYFSLLAKDQGTWCELLKVDGYKRRQALADKVAVHGHRVIDWMLKREGLNWETWQVVRHGRDSKTAVQERSGQYYEIVRITAGKGGHE